MILSSVEHFKSAFGKRASTPRYEGATVYHIEDETSISGALVRSTQRCRIGGALPGVRELRAAGGAYFRMLTRLPLVGIRRLPGGGHIVTGAGLTLLRFTEPYLYKTRGGVELRYPIVGGITAARAGGHVAFGGTTDTGGILLWVEVDEFTPRLGVGRLYRWSQLVVHRLVSIRFMRAWTQELNALAFTPGDGQIRG